MATSTNKLATAKTVLSTLGSIAATTMVARSIINDFLPREIHNYIFSTLRTFFTHHFSSDITFIIDEFHGLEPNHLFEAAEHYLGTCSSATTTTTATPQRRLKISKPESENTIKVALDQNEEVVDVFDDVTFRWVLQCHHIEAKNYYNPRDVGSTLRSEVRSFCLTFHKKAKAKAIDEYLPHVLQQAEVLKHANKTIKLYTTDLANMYGHPGGAWSSITLNHPATFDTLAMDSEIKRTIIDDLDRFVKRKEYYRRVGKAWKRGYLLYGPPGTGKSSLIAAMANYLNFDIYDLELSGLRSDSELRMLLVGTGNKSILVVEDVDCTIELKDRQADQAVANPGFYQEREQVTLSGLLNFIDGLWSSCGDERIIIFTTNHKDKLDPALLRPGRMDMHIHMSYCTPCGFKILANNYLNIKHHALFEDIERLIEEVEITPAEVAEQLMKQDEPDLALSGLLDFLNLRKIENVESKAKQLDKEIEPKANDGDGEVEEVKTNEVQGEIAINSPK